MACSLSPGQCLRHDDALGCKANSAAQLVEIPGVPLQLLELLFEAASGQRLALVGGAVRDLLLHRVHSDPWRGLPDLDLVVEGEAVMLLDRLQRQPGPIALKRYRSHGAFGTVELELQLHSETWLVDLASARSEDYPKPAENPRVSLGSLDDDLARRDFSVNAIALLLAPDRFGTALLDPHGGQADLERRQLRLLHPHSLRDDPTRLLRAARYAARLGFALAPESQQQVRSTLEHWPWLWRPGGDPAQAPPALGTRLRMELELLLEREPWRQALAALQGWGGLQLLDAQLQQDRHWRRRLAWAQRLGVPLLPALVAGSAEPLAMAERLQLPHRQHRLLAQLQRLNQRLAAGPVGLSPSGWCTLLEGSGLSAEAVALAIAAGAVPRRPLLHWWGRWRHLEAPLTAQQLMQREQLQPGPQLGLRLRQLRAERLDQLEQR
jgi:poly(A) polymerase